MTVIHWYRPAHDRSGRSETRCSIHDGEVEDIAWRMMSRIKSQGHEVNVRGGDSTGPNGSTRAIWFDVTVRLRNKDGIRDPEDPGMVWEHAIVTPDELWGLDEAARGIPA